MFNLKKTAHYMMNENYKKNIVEYMLDVAVRNVNRSGNFQDGMLYMIDQIRQIPEMAKNER